MKGAVLLAAAAAIAAIGNFVLNVAVGRGLGAEALGTFTLAVAIARLYYLSTDFGLSAHMQRTIVRTPGSTGDLMGLFVVFRVVLIPLGIAVTIAASHALGDGYWPASLLVAFTMGMVSMQTLFEALFLAHGDQRTVSLFVSVPAILVGGGAIVWSASHTSLVVLCAWYALVNVGIVVGWFSTATRAGWRPRLRWQKSVFISELAQSWPIGINRMLGLAALKCPLFIISATASAEEIGAFAAADMFVTATAIAQSAVTGTTYPKLAATFDREPHEFRRIFWSSNLALASAGFLAAAVIALFGTDIVQLLFPSKDFTQSGDVLSVLGWSAPALLLVYHNVMIFAAAGLDRASLLVMAGWVVLISGCQLGLTPYLGVMAGAWGVLLGRTIGLILVVTVALRTSMHRGYRVPR